MSTQFEVVERAGISFESISDAVKDLVEQANTESPVAWFEVIEERGRITSEGKVELQVKVKIGRKLS